MKLLKEFYRDEIAPCALCHNAACKRSCGKIDLENIMLMLWLDNEYGARSLLPDDNPCLNCENKSCLKACPKGVSITKIIEKLYKKEKIEVDDKDYKLLESDICGIKIENPFLLSSSVVASNYDMCVRALQAGWAGVCYKTITTIDIHETSPRFATVCDEVSKSIKGFKNIEQLSEKSVEENLEIFRKLKKNFPNKFLLVSIMGKNEEEWKTLASECQEAGADAIELNFSCPNMVEKNSGSAIGQDPRAVEKFTRAAKSGCKIPVLAKLTPNVARMSDAAEAAISAGADGLAGINTILSLVEVNDDDKKVALGGYSGNAVHPIALRFIAELCKNEKLRGRHISAMGGVETWRNALSFLLLGARSIQVTTAVMEYGYRIIESLKTGLLIYLKHKQKNLREIIGISAKNVVDVQELKRDIKILPKFDRNRCIGCLRCFVSCQDGGHQAISFDKETFKPLLDAKKCVGCHLCLSVCPQKCISSSDVVLPSN